MCSRVFCWASELATPFRGVRFAPRMQLARLLLAWRRGLEGASSCKKTVGCKMVGPKITRTFKLKGAIITAVPSHSNPRGPGGFRLKRKAKRREEAVEAGIGEKRPRLGRIVVRCG